MKKLIVTIPAYNEEKTIRAVIRSISRSIQGVESVEVLVVSDGSTDGTVDEAKKAGADHIVDRKVNRGLAYTFSEAMREAIARGADIIVNTDADNQYDQSEIEKLIEPIVEEKADMVIGDRQVRTLTWMSPLKRYGNRLGSLVLRVISGTNISDASSGFRAFTANCARSFILLSDHTYTHETIIQAKQKGLRVAQMPIIFRKRTAGESRLIGGVWSHIGLSMLVIVRSVLMYKAFVVLWWAGVLFTFFGLLLGLRFLYFYVQGDGVGHVQSLILAAVLVIVGVNTVFLGMLADLISYNRQLITHLNEKQDE